MTAAGLVDDLLKRFEAAGKVPAGRGRMHFEPEEVDALLAAAEEVVLADPMLLELEPPLSIVGDLRGHFDDLLHILSQRPLSSTTYLFLGNYVNGRQDLKTLLLLLCYKLKYPKNVYLLRGRHECGSITRIYGFYDTCKRRLSVKQFKRFQTVFNVMPVAALVGRERRYLCVSSGLSPELTSFDQIRKLQRPSEVPDCGVLTDLLWASVDDDIEGWSELPKSVSYIFGPDVVERFCSAHSVAMVVCGNCVMMEGHELHKGGRVLTLFSASNFEDWDNSGSWLDLHEDMTYELSVYNLPKICKPKESPASAPVAPRAVVPAGKVGEAVAKVRAAMESVVGSLRRSTSTELLAALLPS